MAVEYKVYKTSALPVTPTPHSFYYVSSGPGLLALYAIGATSGDVRELSYEAEVTITVVGNATISSNDQDIMVNSTLGDMTLTLPPVGNNILLRFYMDEGNNKVTIQRNPADVADIVVGSDFVIMDRKWDSIQLKAKNGKWFIL